MLSRRQGLGAVSCLRKSECLHQLHFNPNLADICPTLFARKKTVVEELSGTLEISRFCQIKNQLEYQRGWSSIQLRIFFQSFNSLPRGTMQKAEGLVQSHVDGNVGGIGSQSILKGRQCAFRIVFLMQQSQTHAGAQDGWLGPNFASLRPLLESGICQATRKIKRSQQVVRSRVRRVLLESCMQYSKFLRGAGKNICRRKFRCDAVIV